VQDVAKRSEYDQGRHGDHKGLHHGRRNGRRQLGEWIDGEHVLNSSRDPSLDFNDKRMRRYLQSF
jgi:hypothetical protein